MVVPQEGFLFGGTIRDNLLIGKPGGATDAEVEAAMRGARPRARGSPRSRTGWPPRYASGARTSRAASVSWVSLVRAALADPAVVVLDEATSSLDPGTERLIELALERLMEGRTVVMIAHRLSTAARADAVAVVEGGHVVEVGSHRELLRGTGRSRASTRQWSGLG